MSKLISFSLWGMNKMYLCGALENTKLASEYVGKDIRS